MHEQNLYIQDSKSLPIHKNNSLGKVSSMAFWKKKKKKNLSVIC